MSNNTLIQKDKFEWLMNKDRSYKLDEFGRRRFKIVEGKTEMINPTTLHYSLHGNRLVLMGGIYYFNIIHRHNVK